MNFQNPKIKRPVALVILDGWGYAPRTEGNAIAIAHTPYYDEICRRYPMTTLATSFGDGQPAGAETGHLITGTGRRAQTEISRIRNERESGEFMNNIVLGRAFTKAKADGAAVHLIGLLSDGGVHSSPENLFALLRMATGSDIRGI